MDQITNVKNEINIYKNQFLGEYLLSLIDNPLYFSELLDDKDSRESYMLNLRAYVLLSHSEIESFLENIAKYYIDKSVEKFKSDGSINKILYWFTLSSTNEINNKNTHNAESKGYLSDPQDFIDLLVERYKSTVNNNHGIKLKNLLSLFSPLGIGQPVLDSQLLILVDSIGTTRGIFAHHGSRDSMKKITSITGPDEITQLIESIIANIKIEILDILEVML